MPDPGELGQLFTKTSEALKLSQANLVVQTYADMVAASFLSFLPTQFVKIIAGLWISAFALTTLDTTSGSPATASWR